MSPYGVFVVTQSSIGNDGNSCPPFLDGKYLTSMSRRRCRQKCIWERIYPNQPVMTFGTVCVRWKILNTLSTILCKSVMLQCIFEQYGTLPKACYVDVGLHIMHYVL